MKKISYKKLFILLRNVLKLFYVSEKEFEKQYYDNKIKETVYELMCMNVKDRFKFIEDIQSKVLQQTISEKEEMVKKIEEINMIIEKYGKV